MHTDNSYYAHVSGVCVCVCVLVCVCACVCVHVHTRLTQISHTGLRCTHLNILHYGMHSCTNVQTHSMSISVLTKVMHISNFSAWTGLNAEVLQAQLMLLLTVIQRRLR